MYKTNELIPSSINNTLSFSVSFFGHSIIIPIFLIFYFATFNNTCLIKKSFYKRDWFFSLILPGMYAFFVIIRSFIWLDSYQHGYIKWDYIALYWFFAWFIYGWVYLLLAILFFCFLVLSLTLMFNALNNVLLNIKAKIWLNLSRKVDN